MGSGHSFPVVSIPKERVIVVTGANTGIGYEIAKWAAMMGATVILACRSEDRTRHAMERMQEEFEMEKRKGTTGLFHGDNLNIVFMKLELGSFKSVVQFCDDFKKSGRQLHVLFCNAGIAFRPYRMTDDGFEEVLQVNYLSHFIITAKLLPVLRQSGPDCRIVMMSSGGHNAANFDMNTINYTGPVSKYGHMDYYGRSKLYQIMQTFCMARRLKGSNITINSMNPGPVKTEIGRDVDTKLWACIISCCWCAFRSPLKGATCGIDLTGNPKLTGVSGQYWDDCRVKTSSSTARNEEKQELLWKQTFEYVKQYLTQEEISGMEGK